MPPFEPSEHELVINWNEGDPDNVHFWTSSAKWVRTLQKWAKQAGLPCKTGTRPSCELCLPVSNVVIRFRGKKRVMSEASKAAARIRMQAMHEKRKKAQG